MMLLFYMCCSLWPPVCLRYCGQEDASKSGADTAHLSVSDISHEDADTRTLLSASLTDRPEVFLRVWTRVKAALLAGFQMVTASGPLMAESLHGVGFAVEKVELSRHLSGMTVDELRAMGADPLGDSTDAATPHESYVSALSMGQLISDVKDAMKVSMLSAKLRIVEPLYKCSIQCDQMQLGNLYPVLSRRRGEVIEEDVIEGTTLFILTVILPVADSFGFSQELLKKTSGSGTAPQLFFSHWRRIDLDPFWKPTTAEELEDLGKSIVEPNLPRVFIDNVRKRKGLVVEEKIVVSAEKQRNLKTNK
jgi:ribosome assembly protein 1